MSFCADYSNPPAIHYAELYRNSIAFSGDIRKIYEGSLFPNQSVAITNNWRSQLKEQILKSFNRSVSEFEKDKTIVPVEIRTRNLAMKFVELLPDGIEEPEITHEVTGEICFEWVQDKKIFSILLNGNHLIYAGIFSGNEKEHGETSLFDFIPEKINKNLSLYFRKNSGLESTQRTA
jgi:hypothetical protein